MSATFFLLACGVMLVANIALAAWNILRLRGWQRAISGLPLVLVAGVVGRVCFEVSRDPTSHNLWPFELALVSALGLVFGLFLRGLFAFGARRHRVHH